MAALQLRLVDCGEDKPKYSIDSSVFLDIWRGNRGAYPKEVHTGLWSHICDLIDDGRIVAHQEVYKELKRHDNKEFQDWLKKNSDKFVLNTQQSNIATRDIINGYYAKFKNGYLPSKKGGSAADPFVVGLAYSENCIVLSQEVPIADHQLSEAQEPAIPNVCAEYKIEYVRINDFLIKEKITLGVELPEPALSEG